MHDCKLVAGCGKRRLTEEFRCPAAVVTSSDSIILIETGRRFLNLTRT